MRKRFVLFKGLQLAAVTVLAGIALYRIFTDHSLYQQIGADPSVRTLCILLWAVLLISFGSILWDLSTHSSMKKDYHELDYAVYNDHVAGIANRYSCDAVIEKYIDRPLPPTLSCIMLDLCSLRKINEDFGHTAGNEAIQEFSSILHTASLGSCFVGRNGGNKFMALFENGSDEAIARFLAKVAQHTAVYNVQEDVPHLEYRTGLAKADEEPGMTITSLIGLSDRRLTPVTDSITGFANRAGVDDIISEYIDQPLPGDLGCIMLEISNIREINDLYGHKVGNLSIRHFGEVLRVASKDLCFVGRNGGTKFLALFRNCTEERMDLFLSRVHEALDKNDVSSDLPQLAFRFGRAFRENEPGIDISRLVALSDRRMRGEE